MNFLYKTLKQILKIVTGRIFLIALLILIQVVFLILGTYFLQTIKVISFIMRVLSWAVVLYIMRSTYNPTYKLSWIILILISPMIGTVFFVVFGLQQMPPRFRAYITRFHRTLKQQFRPSDYEGGLMLRKEDPDAARSVTYLESQALAPVYANTESTFYPVGELFWEALLAELKKAKHYIFLEYFIISSGVMWSKVEEILFEKAAQGVEIRLIYDDLGSAVAIPPRFIHRMEEAGIQTHVFNQFRPSLDIFMNHRDHRKICVIDGNVGFTGGINLADEYINYIDRFGHWKDTAIMLKGEGVWGLTISFLRMWELQRSLWNLDFNRYRPTIHPESDGYVQTFCDDPMDNNRIGENAYLNLIHAAKKNLFITTPYLVLDDEMTEILCTAAQSGVDVRIITPKIPDKWYVHSVTRANYPRLVEAGVRIFEYTPGFIHAKGIVSDDRYAMVGTINFDFRSFYLHFECGTVLYHTKSVLQVRDDFLKTQDLSEEITLDMIQKVSTITRLWRSLLSILSPLI